MCGEALLARRLPDGKPRVEVSKRTGPAVRLLPHPDHGLDPDMVGDWAGNWVQQHLFAQAVLYWATKDIVTARDLADDFAGSFVKGLPGSGESICKDDVCAWLCVWIVDVLRGAVRRFKALQQESDRE